MSSRREIGDGRRYRILKRDGFRCRYCGAHGSEVELQVDHVQPVSSGGSNALSNLMTACRRCNSGKGASTPEWWACSQIFHDDGFPLYRDTIQITNQYDDAGCLAAARIREESGEDEHLFWTERLRVGRQLYELLGRDGIGMARCNSTGWGDWLTNMFVWPCSAFGEPDRIDLWRNGFEASASSRSDWMDEELAADEALLEGAA